MPYFWEQSFATRRALSLRSFSIHTFGYFTFLRCFMYTRLKFNVVSHCSCSHWSNFIDDSHTWIQLTARIVELLIQLIIVHHSRDHDVHEKVMCLHVCTTYHKSLCLDGDFTMVWHSKSLCGPQQPIRMWIFSIYSINYCLKKTCLWYSSTVGSNSPSSLLLKTLVMRSFHRCRPTPFIPSETLILLLISSPEMMSIAK